MRSTDYLERVSEVINGGIAPSASSEFVSKNLEKNGSFLQRGGEGGGERSCKKILKCSLLTAHKQPSHKNRSH